VKYAAAATMISATTPTAISSGLEARRPETGRRTGAAGSGMAASGGTTTGRAALGMPPGANVEVGTPAPLVVADEAVAAPISATARLSSL